MPNSGRRCPIVDDPSVTKDDGAVDEGGQWSKFVQDEKDRGAVGVQPGKGVGQRALVGEIHPAIGSSRMSKSGRVARARAMRTRCC